MVWWGIQRRTELHKNLSGVIRMSAEFKESNIAHSALIGLRHLESILLHIRHGLHAEPKSPQDHTCNVTACPEVRLCILRYIGRVEDRDRHADSPDPQHLEHPEAKKREEFVACAIETIVLACLDDAE